MSYYGDTFVSIDRVGCVFLRTCTYFEKQAIKTTKNEVRIETCFVKVPNEHILKDKAFFRKITK